MELTQSYLKSILNYDPDTGIFTWLIRPASHFKGDRYAKAWNTRHAGNICGSISFYGYRVININNKFHRCGRLAFIFMKGHAPAVWVDHINGIRSDDRWVGQIIINTALRNGMTAKQLGDDV